MGDQRRHETWSQQWADATSQRHRRVKHLNFPVDSELSCAPPSKQLLRQVETDKSFAPDAWLFLGKKIPECSGPGVSRKPRPSRDSTLPPVHLHVYTSLPSTSRPSESCPYPHLYLGSSFLNCSQLSCFQPKILQIPAWPFKSFKSTARSWSFGSGVSPFLALEGGAQIATHPLSPLKPPLPTTRFGCENDIWGQMSLGSPASGSWVSPSAQSRADGDLLPRTTSPPSPDSVYGLFSTVAASCRLSAALGSAPFTATEECKCSSHAFLKDLGNLCVNQWKFIYGFRIFWIIYLMSGMLSLNRVFTFRPGALQACAAFTLACLFWFALKC